jgi:hypothetical protein
LQLLIVVALSLFTTFQRKFSFNEPTHRVFSSVSPMLLFLFLSILFILFQSHLGKRKLEEDQEEPEQPHKKQRQHEESDDLVRLLFSFSVLFGSFSIFPSSVFLLVEV